ncbi:MAG: Rrf2 family transcriptional regulator [Alphaproteobacteria bacterium]|nr:Rrf2 family transcriptional regulator [Alphaproteobacteria bacterium]
MIRIPKKLLFAIEAVLDIAYNAGTQPVQSKDITVRQGIPRRYLEQVLQQLVRADILTGVRGPRGGYLLARERRRITLGEITRVVVLGDESEETSDDMSESDLGSKVVWPIWDDLQGVLMERLDSITIEDLCLNAHGKGIESDSAQRLDFII